jgi:hypothetical protein
MQKIQRDVSGLYDALVNTDDINEETFKVGLEALNKLKTSLSSATAYLKDQEYDPPEAKKLKEEIDKAVLLIGDKMQIQRQISLLSGRITKLQEGSNSARSSLPSVSQNSEKITSTTSTVWKEQWYSPEREKRFREVELGTERPEITAQKFIKGESEKHPGEDNNKPTAMQDKAGNWMMLPAQLSLDFHRLMSVTLNGKLIYATGDSSFDPIYAYRQITAAVTPSQPINIQLSETKESADPGTLEGKRIGALMNQGFAADLFGKMNLISQEEDPPTLCKAGTGTHFEIKTTPTEVEIVYKMSFPRILRDDPEKTHDAIMVKRIIKIPFSELRKTNIDDIQMSVQDRVSNPVADWIYAAKKVQEF